MDLKGGRGRGERERERERLGNQEREGGVVLSGMEFWKKRKECDERWSFILINIILSFIY